MRSSASSSSPPSWATPSSRDVGATEAPVLRLRRLGLRVDRVDVLRGSVEETIPHEADDGPDPVGPPELLSLRVAAAVVGDADLVDPAAEPRDLRGDLGLEAEAVLLDADRARHLAPEHLVAGLHVGEIQVGDHVREEGQHAVRHAVPEEEHAVRHAGEEARAVHHVRATLEDGTDELRELRGVVLEVRVLDDHDVPLRAPEPGAQGGPLALVSLVEDEDVDLSPLAGEGLELLPGA